MRYIIKIQGLDCANCALKLERSLKKIKIINEVNINFMALELRFSIDDDKQFDSAINQIYEVIDRLEPEVELCDYPRNRSGEGIDIHCHDNHCSCSINGEEVEERKLKKKTNIILARITISGIILIINLICEFFFDVSDVYLTSAYIVAYLLIGYDVLFNAVRNIIYGKIFDENFLMTIASIGALGIKEFEEGVAVMLFYQIGELFQSRAIHNSRKSIRSLLTLKAEIAYLEVENKIKEVKPEELEIGNIIIIKPGGQIPIDGRVIFGSTSIDNSSLTGESKPLEIEVGDQIISGGINLQSLIKVEVTALYKNSNVAKIMKLVEESRDKKAKSENFITKFSKYYTPCVVIAAILLCLVPWLIFKQDFNDWFYRSLMFLVISCPCALVISVPLAFFAGLGKCSEFGILVKGGNYLEKLAQADTIVFDKTGTLTHGNFKVDKVVAINIDEELLLKYALLAEAGSNHPIGKSIVEYTKHLNVNYDELQEIEELLGFGVRAKINDREVLCGNAKLLEKRGIEFDLNNEIGTQILVAVDNVYVGYLLVIDVVKSTSINAIKLLSEHQIKLTIMLTGDNQEVAEQIQKIVGIDVVYSSLLPQDKVRIIEEMMNNQKKKNTIIFVGDGTNDAPALMLSDVGIAMGGLGSDAARESCDMVIMDDNLEKISLSIKISRFILKIAAENIIFALSVKLIILVLGALNLVPMIVGVIADVGVSIIAILNSIRILRKKKF